MSAETMSAVVDLDAQMPYTEPPEPDRAVFAREIGDFAEIFRDEAEYWRNKSDWTRAGQSSMVAGALAIIARAEDPEEQAAKELDRLSHALAAVRESVMEARHATARARRNAEKQAAERKVEEDRQAKIAEGNARTIADLRAKIAAQQGTSKEVVKVVPKAR